MDFRIGYRRPLRTASLLRKKRLRNRLWVGVMAAVAVAVTACSWEPGPAAPAGKTAAAPTLHVALQSPAAAPAPAARRIYPHSIIPGGVDSRADIARRVAADPVVARHYASFDIDKAHTVTVGKPRAVHVSYRRGDKVYWTAKKMMLVQGETLLTDGTSDIRGRCGNRISDTAMLPVAMNEPTAAELDESMNVASDPAGEGSLQNASFGLDDLMDGNPTAFQRFASFAVATDAPPVALPDRPGMPSVPAGAQNGMGLMPTSYLSVSSGPALALGPASQGSVTVTPPAAEAAPAAATPAVPAAAPAPAATPAAATPAAATPSVPTTPAAPAAPAASDTPIKTVPDTPATPVTPVVPAPPVIVDGPVAPIVPGTPVANPAPPATPALPHGDIPEPGTLWLVGAAFALMLLATRKQRRAA